ncbi:MAG: aminotransferase class IV [Myxococcota bacterium]
MSAKVYIGGAIVDPSDATISVFDRGFLYGDSVYETMRVYENVPFAFAAHVERLYSSGQRIGFELPWPSQEVRGRVEQTLSAAALGDAYLRVIATRGRGVIGLDPTLAVDPQLIVMALELPELPAEMYERGRCAWLVSVPRNLKRALDPLAKTGNYMNSVLAAGEARAHGADEAIMLDHRGRIAEGSSANVFALIDWTWCTPPVDVGILPGITRRTILELCRREGIAVDERVLWPDDLRAAQEMFVSSSVREMIPIVRLNDEPIGTGEVGGATRRLHANYRAEVEAQVAVR